MNITLISTPIGNLGDISKNAIDAITQSDLVLAEDTRVFKGLVSKLEIEFTNKKIISFNDHSQDNLDFYIQEISNSSNAILVSDAGSPIVSDPGYILVKKIVDSGGTVSSLPGPSAVTTALELSGFAPNPYAFYGFIPRKKNEIISKLNISSMIGGTSLFFESPYRICATLEILRDEFPDIKLAVCRELTKKFETVSRFMAKDYKSELINPKGEFVIVIEWPKDSSSKASSGDFEKLAQNYMQKKTPKNLSKLLAKILDKKVDEIYQDLSSQ